MRPKKVVSKYFALLLLSAVVTVIQPAYGETFSFAVIADPHIDGNPDHRAKFETSVDWIIDNKESKDIELTFVLGDIAWGGTKGNRNLAAAKKILDPLGNNGIPYIPVIGDNEIQAGCEKEFQDVFGPHFNTLSRILGNWRKAPVPAAGKYLQNFSFGYKDNVDTNYAGHLHLNWYVPVWSRIFVPL